MVFIRGGGTSTNLPGALATTRAGIAGIDDYTTSTYHQYRGSRCYLWYPEVSWETVLLSPCWMNGTIQEGYTASVAGIARKDRSKADEDESRGSRHYLEEDYAGELSLIGGFLNPIVPGWGNTMLPKGCGIRCKEGYWWYDIYLWAGSRC